MRKKNIKKMILQKTLKIKKNYFCQKILKNYFDQKNIKKIEKNDFAKNFSKIKKNYFCQKI